MNLLVALALGSFVAAPVPKEPPKPVGIEGEWKIVEFVKNGRPREKGPATMTIKGDKMTISDGKRDEIAAITLDPKTNPATIDIRPEKNGNPAPPDKVVKGIYKIEKDKLIICYSMDDAERPKEFKSDPDSKTGMFTLERVKK